MSIPYLNRFAITNSERDNEVVCRTSGFIESARNRARELTMKTEAEGSNFRKVSNKEKALIKNRTIVHIEGHTLYRDKYVFKNLLNNLSFSTARRYSYTGHIPAPIYRYKYRGKYSKYYSDYQVKCINMCYRKNPKRPLEERVKTLHEKFKRDPLLEIYNKC